MVITNTQKVFFTLLGMVFITSAVIAPKAHAIDGESITLSPTSVRFKLDAGDSQKGELTIINDGNTTYDFELYGAPYSVTSEDYIADYTTQASNADAYKWVTFAQKRYHAVPNQVLTIPYTFSVPKGAAPGGHYGVIFAETKAVNGINLGAASINRQKRVGAIMYTTVNGTYRVGGELLSQKVSTLQFKAPLAISVTAKNTGNTDFISKTSLSVSDVFNHVKYKTDKESVVLPNTTRKMSYNWEQAPQFGLFKVTVKTSFLDTDKTSTHYVLMSPLWGYLVFAIGILGLVMYFVQRRR